MSHLSVRHVYDVSQALKPAGGKGPRMQFSAAALKAIQQVRRGGKRVVSDDAFPGGGYYMVFRDPHSMQGQACIIVNKDTPDDTIAQLLQRCAVEKDGSYVVYGGSSNNGGVNVPAPDQWYA